MPETFNCTSLSAGTMLDMCTAVYELENPTECVGINYVDADLGCVAYENGVVKASGMLGDQNVIDTGNNAWMLGSAALVFIMTPGLSLFYGGLSGVKNVSNTILMSWSAMFVVTIQWFLFGYSLAFGPGSNGLGNFFWGCLVNIPGKNPSGAYGLNIPHYTWIAFQCMFAMITPALISGAVVGRFKFWSWLIFVFIWTTIVYDPLAHWVWSFEINEEGTAIPLGWLGVLGAADFAGGAVIHISSGFAALAAALVLGKRTDYSEAPKPHNAPYVLIGASLLWFGWFGFNAGSAGGATPLASFAFINTQLATAMAAFSWMVMERIFASSPTAAGAASGMVAGLVAITPACGYVFPWHSVIIGLIVSPFCYGACKLKGVLGVDDTLDAWGIHGIGGVVGAFLTGLFATPSVNSLYTGAFYGFPNLLGFEMAAIVTSASYSFFLTLIVLVIMKMTIGIRVSEEVESLGMDESEHGGSAYVTGAATSANSKVEDGRPPANTMVGYDGDNPKYSMDGNEKV